MKNQACIIGIGQTDYCRKPGSGMTQLGIQLKAAAAAIADAGLKGQDIDGIMPFPNLGHAEGFAANLGCENLATRRSFTWAVPLRLPRSRRRPPP